MLKLAALLFLALTVLAAPDVQAAPADPQWIITLPAQPGTQVAGEHRVALVIGNAAYKTITKLKNPVKDATAIRDSLTRLGFDVIYTEDATQAQMRQAIRSFAGRLRQGSTALVFYAGHGIQLRGANHLVPIDANPATGAEAEEETVPLDSILTRLDEARLKVSIVILDACREDPFAGRTRAVQRGLASVTAPGGTMIAYATAPGSVALDGDGAHGLFSGELLNVIESPGLRIEDLFKRVRAKVQERSGGRQVPWDASSLTEDFYFKPAPGAAPLQSAAIAPGTAGPLGSPRGTSEEDAELIAFTAVARSESPAALEAFLASFPNGRFAGVARARLNELRGAGKTAPGPASAPSPLAGIAEQFRMLTPIPVPVPAPVPAPPVATAPVPAPPAAAQIAAAAPPSRPWRKLTEGKWRLVWEKCPNPKTRWSLPNAELGKRHYSYAATEAGNKSEAELSIELEGTRLTVTSLSAVTRSGNATELWGQAVQVDENRMEGEGTVGLATSADGPQSCAFIVTRM